METVDLMLPAHDSTVQEARVKVTFSAVGDGGKVLKSLRIMPLSRR